MSLVKHYILKVTVWFVFLPYFSFDLAIIENYILTHAFTLCNSSYAAVFIPPIVTPLLLFPSPFLLLLCSHMFFFSFWNTLCFFPLLCRLPTLLLFFLLSSPPLFSSVISCAFVIYLLMCLSYLFTAYITVLLILLFLYLSQYLFLSSCSICSIVNQKWICQACSLQYLRLSGSFFPLYVLSLICSSLRSAKREKKKLEAMRYILFPQLN